MKKLEDTFNKISKDVHLTNAEKTRMREYLFEYQAMKPFSGMESAHTNAKSNSFFPVSFLSWRPMPVIAVAVIFLAGAGGVSAAAGHTLPGDVLYPIKVSVNEKIEGALAFSNAAKAAFETKLADRRLSEAEALAEKGNLSAAAEATLESGFAAHAKEAKAHIAQLKSVDANAALVSETRLHAVFAAHTDILAGVLGNEPEKGNLVWAIRSEASDNEDAAIAVALGANNDATSSRATSAAASAQTATSGNTDFSAAESMREAALSTYGEAQSSLAQFSKKLSAQSNASALASLSAAKALIAAGDAEVALGTNDSIAAGFSEYQKAFAAEEELMLRVRSNASIQLPIIVTPRVLVDFASMPSQKGKTRASTRKGTSADSESVQATVRGILDAALGTSTSENPSSSDRNTNTNSEGLQKSGDSHSSEQGSGSGELNLNADNGTSTGDQ